VTESGDRAVPLAIDEAAIDADLRSALGPVELTAPDAAMRIWAGFLAHASRPLDFGERFARDKDNDLLGFATEKRPTEIAVRFARRIGVVEDGEYAGTIVAACRLTVEPSSAWEPIAQLVTVDEYGVTAGGLEAYRAAVEASPAFAALALSPVTGLRAVARYH
jgi:hypothetical protein